jgi:hypothetical protein
VTIGGRRGGDGKRHGGSPVYIEGGRIARGAPALKGRRIDALKERPEERSHRADLNRSREYTRAAWAKRARKEGIPKQELHQLAGEILAHDREHVEARRLMLQDAWRHARALGTDLRTLAARAAGGIDDDAVRGLDDVAESMAEMYPEQFAGHRGDAASRLFDLLAEGDPRPMREDDAFGQAMEVLREHRRRPEREEEDTPAAAEGGGDGSFDFGANTGPAGVVW